MKIGLFTDVHYCTKDVLCNTRWPALSLDKLREMLKIFRDEKVEFMVCLGDLIDTDENDDINMQNLKQVSDIIQHSNIECYCCMGNHDSNLFNELEFKTITNMKIAPYVFSKQGKLLIFLDANYTKQEVK